jgi:hypothetical protein
MERARSADLVLRIGAAFAFLYPPLAALGDPLSWYGYFPAFIQALPIAPMVLLHGFGLVEVILAFWMLSGHRVFMPAAAATLLLLAIVLFNLPNFEVLFRDLSIACMTAALALNARSRAQRGV